MAKSEGCPEVKNLPITNKPYISCIRIHGLRILPPILSEEKRHRMQYYKELAIKVEERIQTKKLNKPSTDSTDDSLSTPYVDSNSSTISDSVIYSSDEEQTYKSQVFSDSCRSDVLKMLPDSPKTAITNVPLKHSEESDTNKCLIKNMIDLPEILTPNPTSDTNKLFTSNVVEKMNAENEKSSSIFYENIDLKLKGAGDNTNVLDENKNESPRILSPPVLIRSNSYILDSPSPFLLAFMKQNSYPLEIKSTDINNKKRRTWDLEKAREKWTSIEHDLNIVADKNSGFKRLENFNSLPNSSAPSPDNKMFDSRLENIKRTDSLHFPEKDCEIPISEPPKHMKRIVTTSAKIFETSRFIKSFVTPLRPVNPEKDVKIIKEAEPRPKRSNESIKKTELNIRKHESPLQRQRKISNHNIPKKEIILPKKPDIISCDKSEQQIRDVIDKIHNEQSKQMSDLISRQKKEQEHLMRLFAEQQALVLSELKSTYRDTNEEPSEKSSEIQVSIVPEPDILKNSENLLFECKKLLQQESLSPCSDTSNQTLTCMTLNDTLSNDVTLKSGTPSPKNISTDVSVSLTSRFSHSFSIDSLEPLCNGSASKNKIKRNINCSRQLFPTTQQVWAATKINSFARGYLVRRLIKTERVQDLIKTIRDTLVCAMQLHHETADKIQPADVELHRRLIQQVTAACYSFHDTFFELSKTEQLAIIASDRDRQKEKLLRPTSAKSNSSLSSTTQRVLERKMRRSSDSASGAPSRSSSSRSCYSANEFRVRTKSLGLSDSIQTNRKTSPQNDVMRHAMSYGANKKPWR